MKTAILTATLEKDYELYAQNTQFKNIVEQEWSRWHVEVYRGTWFGLISRQKQILFLAGRIPTQRKDSGGRDIVDFVFLQPETHDDFKQIVTLASDLLTGKQDINNPDSPFAQWADKVCMAFVDSNFVIEQMSFLDYSSVTNSSQTIGRFEYPLDAKAEREKVAQSIESLLNSHKDFVVGCVNYSSSRFIKQVCKDLTPNAQITIFSAQTTEKKEIPEKEMPQNPRMKIATLSIVAILLILCTILFLKNGTLSKDIVKLQNELQAISEKLDSTSQKLNSMTSENVSLTKEITVLKAENEQLKEQVKTLPKP